jgi:hypothetical protein
MDRAVWYFATCLNEDMDKAERALGDTPKAHEIEKARQAVYNEYVPPEDLETTTPPKGRFADPMLTIKNRR